MIKAITEPAFDYVEMPVASVRAFQTTRLSPCQNTSISKPFDAFNLGLHVGDIASKVKRNRSRLADYLPKETQIQWLEQVHGNSVVVIDEINKAPIMADAMVTSEPQLALAIMTADCLPILLSSKSGDEIAAIHGGWRPLSANIIKRTLDLMNTNNEQIHAWLGPCIGETNFEVGDDVKEAFTSLSLNFESSFTAGEKGKWLGNLRDIAKIMLYEQGVKHIGATNVCTFGDAERYYSYRRESRTGRMASIICIA